LAGLLRIRQHGGVYVDHDLVAISGSAGIEVLMQRRLRQQSERVCLPLGHRREVSGRVGRARPSRDPRPLVQGLAGGGERLCEQLAHFGLETAPDHHHAVLVLIHVK
jgi:hypothetical protein